MVLTLIRIGGVLSVAAVVACGGGGGAPPPKRTVSGTFQTVHWSDNGTKTTVAGPPKVRFGRSALAATALLIPDTSAAGYAQLSLTLDAIQGFSVADVPAGPYFLEIGATVSRIASCNGGTQPIDVKAPLLFDLATSTPDLGAVTSARSDLSEPTTFTRVTLDITGMDAWASGDRIQMASSQARTNQRAFFSPPPATGVTSFTGTSPWFGFGLPDASKNDVVSVYQRATTPLFSGAAAASFHRATRFARLTNLTVADGATTATAVALGAAPQTGTIGADLRSAQFAAFATDVNPGATLSVFSLLVLGVPHSSSYPDMPPDEVTPILELEPSSAIDADFGTLAYGQFLDPLWKEVRRVFYTFDVTSVGEQGLLFSDVPASALPAGPIAPVLSPPKSPRVNGKDAFANQTGTGVQPTISWSPPALGAPTSYVVEILPTALPCSMAGQTVGVTATVHGSTSFKVPPGLLQAGLGYRAVITARQAPWDALDVGPFRTGTPLHSAQVVTAMFSP
jgi:hypothetical protein